MTRIIYRRSGGVLGNEIQFEQELESLSEEDEQHLMLLIREADFFNFLRTLLCIPARMSSNITSR